MVERESSPNRVVFGVILILLGVAFMLDQLNFLDLARLFDLSWRVMLILAGVWKLTWPGSSSSRRRGLALIVIGLGLTLESLGWIRLDFDLLWPLALVVLGLAVLWSGWRRSATWEDDSDRTVNALAILGGTSRSCSSLDFRGGDLVAVMGACEVDLRQAWIANSPAVIDAFAFWGGVELRVPESWTVVVRGIPILGGYSQSTRAVEKEGDLPQQLIVKGFAIMGGVEIKN